MLDKVELKELKSSGLTYKQLGERFNVSPQYIHQVLTGYKSPWKHTEAYRVYLKAKYQKTKDKDRKYYKQWWQKLKTEALTYYGNGKLACIRCGFTDIRALTVDHIEGGGYQHRLILRKNIYVWLRQQGYPEGFQTLCGNCQLIKREENKENHG